MKKQLLVLIGLVFGCQVHAQENIFLERDFWDTKPTIALIDSKIEEGNDIAAKNANSFDAVVYAILQNTDNSVIEYIQSKKGNDVNKLTHDGRTYIFWAAYKGNDALMEYLISKGAKTTITDDKGSTILNFAASSGQQNTKVYDICLAHGADLKKDLTPNGANALLLASQNDPDFKLLDYFSSKGLSIHSVDRNGNDMFNYVAKTGNIERLKKVYEKGVKGNDNVFIFASQGGRNTQPKDLAFYTFLASLGLNPDTVDAEGKTPLHAIASYGNDTAVVAYFMEKGVEVNAADKNGNTAFLLAANVNKMAMLAYLLPKVKDINHQNKKGESALALAVAHNSPEIVAFLLKNKAAITGVDENKNNIVYYLLESYGSPDFDAKLKLLKEQGLDLGKPQENGNTLYHLALAYNDVELLKIAQQFGADVNAKNKEGITPLHVAAMRAKDAEALKYLLAIGAKKNALTAFDESVYDLASENEVLQEKKISIEFLK